MFFGTRSSEETATRVDARHQAEIKGWWRDWHRYLNAHLQLLDSRRAETNQTPNFERTDLAWEQQRSEAEQTLRRIPQDRRVIFDQARDTRRAEVQDDQEAKHQSLTSAVDPDVVERDALQSLIAQAQGTGEGLDRWGAVPLPNGWYELQVDALMHAPTAADYSVALEETDDRRKYIVLIGSLLLLAVVGVWWTWPRQKVDEMFAPQTIQINGQNAEPWQIVSITTVDDGGLRTSLPVTTTDELAWPLSVSERGAWVRLGTHVPMELCLPTVLLATVETLEVYGIADVPVRAYTLSPHSQAHPDLTVTACGAKSTLSPRFGRLERVTSRSDHQLHEPVQLSGQDEELRVTGVEVFGAGQDPQLPLDNVRVVVRVKSAMSLDWTRLDPHLVLQTGQDIIPGAPIQAPADQSSGEIVYLVPVFAMPLDAAWLITDPDTQLQLRWRFKLEPPQNRANVLRGSLAITVTGKPEATADSATVTLVVRNTTAKRLTLKNDDLTVIQQDRVLPVSAFGRAGVDLRPRESRTFTLPLRGIDWEQDLIVSLGAARFRLRFMEQ